MVSASYYSDQSVTLNTEYLSIWPYQYHCSQSKAYYKVGVPRYSPHRTLVHNPLVCSFGVRRELSENPCNSEVSSHDPRNGPLLRSTVG